MSGSIATLMVRRFEPWALAALLCCTSAFGQVIMEFPVESVGSITSGPDGAIWFSSLGKIGRIDTAGAITEFRTTAVDAQNLALAFGPDGNLWFTGPGRISRMTTSGVVTEFSVPGLLPTEITSGPDGNLWFTAFSANRIGRITTSGVITEFPLPTPAAYPVGIAAGPDGNLWFTESSAQKIGRITTDGAITELALPRADSFPAGIAAGPDGNLWFAERGDRVGRITATGQVTEFPVSGGETYDVVAGTDGNLWFVGWGEVHRVTTTGAVTTFSAIPTSQPRGVAVSPDGAIWIAGSYEENSQIVRFSPDTSACLANATALCLDNGRFRVTADWKARDGSTGHGHGVNLTASSGYFWFFDSANVEMVVKVLDGCSANQHHWAFAAGLTNVEVTTTVTDTYSGLSRTYTNSLGSPFAPIQDTSAFAACQ